MKIKLPEFSDYCQLEWSEIEPLYQQLKAVELSRETQDQWMEIWSELRKLDDERYARLALAVELDTEDQEAEASYHAYLDEILPGVRTADQKLKEKLLQSGLIPAGLELSVTKMQVEADLFCEENLPLMTEESKLGTEYSKIMGAQTINWEGQELTLTQAKSHLLTEDRSVRKAVWERIAASQLEDRDAIDRLWTSLMDIRGKLAANAGYGDYRSFRWRQKLRLDYSPEDSKQFLQAVQEKAVPAATRVYQRYQKRLKINSVRPWDLLNNQTTFSLPPLQVFETEEQFINRVGKILSQLDPTLGGYFDIMREEKLLDLLNRKGKGPGGFCTSFATRGRPFIFMNATGRSSDLRVLFHESGHAFHVFERVNLVYHHQWRPGMEFAEVASTAMELLAEPYLSTDQGGFMDPGDAARTRQLNLEEKLLFWPYMAVVVAFQHWVYENEGEGKDPRACDRKWGELIDQYMPGINWDGLDDVKQTGWHRKLHIHQAPFYYIEYGLASLGAFQIYQNAKTDPSRALADYRRSLTLGGTVSLPELYRAAGAELAFDARTLGEIVELIENELKNLERIIQS